MAKATTIRVVLNITVTKGWRLRRLDFNNAFLNGKLDEDVYMHQPSKYVHPQYPNYVCKLDKAIYGLKQPPRVWSNTLCAVLVGWGFKNSKSDTSLFIFHSGSSAILLLVYVDDVIITGNDSTLISCLIVSLDIKFALKDLGDLN